MKNVICLMSLVGVFALGACETNTVKNTEDNAMMDRRDTSAIREGYNSRGVPAEGVPDNNAVRGDTIQVQGNDANHSEAMAKLPQAVADKITNDETLRTKKLTNSREFTEAGTTYYELTFDDGGSTVTFDQKGNRRTQ